jgi:hypothetical protein
MSAWRAETPGKVMATAEALTGPTTPEGARVQVHNAPGAEVGPGQIATWGRATTDRADAFGFTWDRSGKSANTSPLAGPAPPEPAEREQVRFEAADLFVQGVIPAQIAGDYGSSASPPDWRRAGLTCAMLQLTRVAGNRHLHADLADLA